MSLHLCNLPRLPLDVTLHGVTYGYKPCPYHKSLNYKGKQCVTKVKT